MAAELEDDDDAALQRPLEAPTSLATTVGAAWQDQRLDRVLALWQPEVSRSHLQTLIEQGALRLDGQVCQQSARRLRLGQRLELALRPPDSLRAFEPEAMALPIVHEDAELLVINKPVGLVVHPAAGHWTGTLMNGLLAHHAQAAQLPRAGIVHRLDKDTSGLMVVAKTAASYTALVAQLAAREVRREYLALCHKAWGPACSVDAPIGRDPRQRIRMAVVPEPRGGKAARTDFQPIDQTPLASSLHCQLHTGRTHQIRVHAALQGHPLLADLLYGGKALGGLQRQALHAARLSLLHPGSGRSCQWQAEAPADLAAAAEQLGLRLALH